MKPSTKFLLQTLIALTCAVAAAAVEPETPTPPASQLLQPEAGFGTQRPTARVAPHVTTELRWLMPAAPEKIFPLLCPVLEYDWIASWRTNLIHSQSGVAEENCVFETRFADGHMIWICTRYEPTSLVEYTCFSEHGVVVRLKVTLSPVAGGTEVLWKRSWYACNAEGEAWVSKWNRDHYERMMEYHKREMEHFLRTGTLLKSEMH